MALSSVFSICSSVIVIVVVVVVVVGVITSVVYKRTKIYK